MSAFYDQVAAQTYQEYVLSETNDRDRLMMQHNIFKPAIIGIFQQVLLEYGLLHKLQQAKTLKEAGASFAKIRILDFGCSEGLYLCDLAALLETYDLLDVVELVGVDLDATSIANAREFCKVSDPPRPYIKFFDGDLLQPFQSEGVDNTPTDAATLAASSDASYDFIFAILVTVHLTEAQHQIHKIYQHLLKPTGVIYLRDTMLELVPPVHKTTDQNRIEGWSVPHPAIYPLLQQLVAFMQSKNPGIEVATAQAGWLREFGAAQVTTQHNFVVSGGATVEGREMLRNLVIGIRNSAPFLISRGLATQAQYDTMIKELFTDFSVYSQGYNTIIDTLAYKPARKLA
jgi:SAM-dependent methyltransferase